MDIASAKQQIKNTVQIYLQKDALGRYRLPLVHQAHLPAGCAGSGQDCHYAAGR